MWHVRSPAHALPLLPIIWNSHELHSVHLCFAHWQYSARVVHVRHIHEHTGCLSVARLQLKFKCYRSWMLHAFSVHLAFSEMTSSTEKWGEAMHRRDRRWREGGNAVNSIFIFINCESTLCIYVSMSESSIMKKCIFVCRCRYL